MDLMSNAADCLHPIHRYVDLNTQQEVDDFVSEATQRIYKVYQDLWVEKVSIPNEKTFLTQVIG